MTKTLSIAALAAGLAGAASRPARADGVAPPAEHVVGVIAEWLPSGQTTYSGNQGEANFDVAQAFGVTAWLGWELSPGFEIGGQVRYIANEQITGDTSTGSEIITAVRIAAHARPSPNVDLAFVVLPGYSHVFVPADFMLPDAGGFTVDFGGEATVPIDRSLSAVFSLGYQRGFQRTTEPPQFAGASTVTAWATGYLHLGVGVAKRF